MVQFHYIIVLFVLFTLIYEKLTPYMYTLFDSKIWIEIHPQGLPRFRRVPKISKECENRTSSGVIRLISVIYLSVRNTL